MALSESPNFPLSFLAKILHLNEITFTGTLKIEAK
jgi:hypothetical protein